jgi:hypothetical protein
LHWIYSLHTDPWTFFVVLFISAQSLMPYPNSSVLG